MPRTYSNPYDVMAQRLGSGIAQLFAPRDNTQAMKYMLGASQIGENRANINKLDSETGLNTQEQGFRSQLGDPAAVGQVMPDAAPGLAQLFAAALGLSTGGEDGVDAISHAIGTDKMMRATGEGDMRLGYALTGHDANVNNALTSSGITDLFGQQTSINDADNDTLRANAGTAAAATRYGADRRYAASVFGDNLHYGVGGASDRSAATVADRAAKRAAAKGTAGYAMKPSDAAAIGRELVKSLPGGANLDGQQIAEAVSMVGEIMGQNGGDAGTAISQVAQLFATTPGAPNEDDPGKFDVLPTANLMPATSRPGVRIIDPRDPRTMRQAPPGGRTAPAAASTIDDLVNRYLGN